VLMLLEPRYRFPFLKNFPADLLNHCINSKAYLDRLYDVLPEEGRRNMLFNNLSLKTVLHAHFSEETDQQKDVDLDDGDRPETIPFLELVESGSRLSYLEQHQEDLKKYFDESFTVGQIAHGLKACVALLAFLPVADRTQFFCHILFPRIIEHHGQMPARRFEKAYDNIMRLLNEGGKRKCTDAQKEMLDLFEAVKNFKLLLAKLSSTVSLRNKEESDEQKEEAGNLRANSPEFAEALIELLKKLDEKSRLDFLHGIDNKILNTYILDNKFVKTIVELMSKAKPKRRKPTEQVFVLTKMFNLSTLLRNCRKNNASLDTLFADKVRGGVPGILWLIPNKKRDAYLKRNADAFADSAIKEHFFHPDKLIENTGGNALDSTLLLIQFALLSWKPNVRKDAKTKWRLLGGIFEFYNARLNLGECFRGHTEVCNNMFLRPSSGSTSYKRSR